MATGALGQTSAPNRSPVIIAQANLPVFEAVDMVEPLNHPLVMSDADNCGAVFPGNFL
jgi:hypothetical protein